MGTVFFRTHDDREFKVAAEPGDNLMRLATSNAVPGIVAECGGSLSCATCHVYLDEAGDHAGTPSDAERAMLAFAFEPRATSRLSCQVRYGDEMDGMNILIPAEQ